MRSMVISFALCITAATAAAEAPRIQAVRTTQPPVIDGRVEEAVWALAPAVTALEQQRPDNGEPSSEEIRIHVLYDDDAIYVGAHLPHRRSPVVRLLARRDTFLDSDWFGIMLDSQYDRRSALGFFVNPEGVQLDESVTNDDQEDYDWDSVWQSAAVVGEEGWSAELRIPLSLFRFTERSEQVWGVQIIRWVRARQEQARLASSPRDQKGFVSRFGDLVGLENIRPRPKLEVLPYATSGALRNEAIGSHDPLGLRSRTSYDGGVDLRWTSRSSVTVSATLNPDFGQVEVDPAILNLSEFELLFPEKRPFFVEGSKLFTFGGIASAYSSPYRIAHPLLFYSRRIGRTPSPALISGEFVDVPSSTRILGAVKVIGRTANDSTFTIIDAITDEETARSWSEGIGRRTLVEPRANYLAGRWMRDFGERSRVGALLTSVIRDNAARTPLLASTATVAGIDGYTWFGDRSVVLDWMLAASEIEGSRTAISTLQRAPAHTYQRPDADHLQFDPFRTSLEGWGGKAILSREAGTWRYQLGVQNYSPGFDLNELGFHSRSDLVAAHAQGTWFDVKKRRHTRSNRITVGWYGSENGGGDTLSNAVTAQYSVTFINWWTLSATASRGLEAIDDRETRGGPSIARPAGWSSQMRLISNTAKRAWIDLQRNDGGDDFGGSVQLTSLGIGYRPRSNVTAQVVATHATTRFAQKFIGVSNGRYILGELVERRLEVAPRLDWTISRNLTFQLYLQPFAASGSYDRIGELLEPGERYVPFDEGQPVFINDPDFRFRSFRGNAVLRWEVGAATIFAVWNEGREARTIERTLGRVDDFETIGDVPAEDRLLLKVSYRFELPK
jgi:hypothetical protein